MKFLSVLLGCLAIFAGAAQSEVINGRSYTSLAAWARANGFRGWTQNGGTEFILTNQTARLVFDKDSADATIKGAGSPGVPLTDQQKAYFQSRVDAAGKDFHQAVAKARGALPDAAKTGAVFYAGEAKGLGLIDRVGGHSFAVAALKKEMRARG